MFKIVKSLADLRFKFKSQLKALILSTHKIVVIMTNVYRLVSSGRLCVHLEYFKLVQMRTIRIYFRHLKQL